VSNETKELDMASISSLGIGANLDLAGLLDQLKAEASTPLKAIQQRQVSFTSKLSAYGQIQSGLTTLQNAAKKLGDPAFFTGMKASVSAPDVLSAAVGANTAAGTYAINVSQLAQAQSVVTVGQASAKAAIGNGTITIDFGTINGGALDPVTGKYTGAGFTVDATRTAVPVTIDASNNSLEGIRDAINAAKAGVNASIVNDGSGTPNRLVLVSAQTGEASSMRISVAGDAALQNLLNNDPSGTQNLKQTVVGQNTKLTVNGIDVTSATNTVKEAIQGTTLTVLKAGTSTLTTSSDTASVESAVNDLVKAYNSLLSTSKTLTAYDTDKKTGAALVGDSTLRNLMTRVRQAFIAPQAGGANDMKVLTEIGVGFQKDGTLAVDSAKLKAALVAKPEQVANLFSSPAASTGGYGKQLSAIVDDLTSSGGSLKVATDGINTTLKQLDVQYSSMQDHVDATVDHYRKQFSQLDLMMSSMNNTVKYLSQQFDAMSAKK
jgi:flagellar hook-associated protein 2